MSKRKEFIRHRFTLIKTDNTKQKVNKEYKHSEITEKIIKAAYEVYNTLGYGFLEKVYENALAIELKESRMQSEQQKQIKVYYKKNIVGDYIADLIVENKVVVEIKAIQAIEKIHEVQLVNYLKATDMDVGLLINFGPEIQIKRKIYDQ